MLAGWRATVLKSYFSEPSPNLATPNLAAEEITIPLTWGNLAGKFLMVQGLSNM